MLASLQFITSHKVALQFVSSHKEALLSNDIVVDDGWSIPSIFSQQTVKQLEVTQEVFLSEVSKPNNLYLWGNEQK